MILNYRFRKDTREAQRNFVVASLRKDGFTAYRETDSVERVEYLKTNATFHQINLSVGQVLVHN